MTLVLGFLTWLIGIPLLILVVVGFFLYARARRASGQLAPADTPDETRPPPDRDRTWDPQERYGGEEPPAAR